MSEAKRTTVKKETDIRWTPFEEHDHVAYKEIVSAADADELGVALSSVLWEKIDAGGAVLPHYHDVAEIIHITVGKVRLYCNGEWTSHQAGDTFLVPAGVVHSVQNDDAKPTEQVSLFIPTSDKQISNIFFKTYRIDI